MSSIFIERFSKIYLHNSYNNILKIFYNDYLCVDKRFRKKFGIRRKIQMIMCKDAMRYDINAMLYALDNRDVPYHSFQKIQYYSLSIKIYFLICLFIFNSHIKIIIIYYFLLNN